MMNILTIANDIANRNNANGKTICNYLDSKYSNYNLFCFYVNGQKDTCNKHFFVSDIDALNSLKTFGKKQFKKKAEDKDVLINNIKSNKTALKHLLRYYVWKSGFWKKSGFDSWIHSFNPNLIILLLGDNIYLIQLAIDLSKYFNIPIHVLIGENYCFKKHNYIERKIKPSIVYNVFHHKLYKITKECCKKAQLTIFNSKELCNLYSEAFKLNNTIINIPSSQLRINSVSPIDANKVIYAGNLGINRDKSLCVIAKLLEKIDSKISFYIYGNGKSEIIEELKKCNNIIYGGYISNDSLIKEMETAKLLVHCESFDEYDIIDLQYAFSTKIADYLASGKKFIVYAPSELVETKFLMSSVPEMVATNINELEIKLRNLLEK